MKVELTTRGQSDHAVLSVIESTHVRPQDARQRAVKVAVAYAKRYGLPIVCAQPSGRYTIHDGRGITVAQVDAR